MKRNQSQPEAHAYWEGAGARGYKEAMYRHADVANHVTGRVWNTAVQISRELGVGENARVLDLGCGDGSFANSLLAAHFAKVDGLDAAEAAIHRARSNAPREDIRFERCNIAQLDFSKLPRYDAVFLIGILHHVKTATPLILRGLRTVTDRIIVLEPNGSHLVRRLLERTPAYRAAGEDSFTTRQLERIFAEAGFGRAVWLRRNLFPNFTPRWVFKTLLPLERVVEATPLLRTLCTVNLWGFVAENPVAGGVARQ